MKNSLSLAVGLLLAGAACGASAQDATDEWSHSVHLYGMAVAIDGDTELGPLSLPVSMSISDVFDALRMGGMVAYRADNGRWSFSTDLTYMDLGWRASKAGGRAGARLDVDQLTFMATGGKRLNDNTELLFSLAYFDVDAYLRLSVLQQSLSASRDANWVDPLIGVAYELPMGDKWKLKLRGDVGGFGINSDFTWHAWAIANRQVTDRFSWFMGYRAISYDYSEGSGAQFVRFDTTQHGPGAGISYTF